MVTQHFMVNESLVNTYFTADKQWDVSELEIWLVGSVKLELMFKILCKWLKNTIRPL